MNSEILKNWEPEEIRESQLNDKKIIKFLYNCISDKKRKNLIGIKFQQKISV
jgi:hypothetical protein